MSLGKLSAGTSIVLGGRKVSKREEVMSALEAAATQLGMAYSIAVESNAMAADLPVFKEVAAKQKEVVALMQQVSRVRGLGE